MIKLKSYTIIGIVILAFLPLIYQVMSPQLTTDELFSKNFTIPKMLVTREGFRNNNSAAKTEEATQQKELYYEAIEAYSKKEYASAVLLFERYLELAASDRKDIALQLGVAQLMLDQYTAAQEEFEFLLEHGSANKKEDAEWYLVLTLLKQNQVEQVNEKLTQLLSKTPASSYQEKAQDLLKEIQQL